MSSTLNTLQIKTLGSLSQQASPSVLKAIQSASTQSGVDFSYLLQQASVESGFNPSAKAGTSSATGLYQFIDSTWLQMVERYGDDYGLNTDGMSKQEILKMRNDPQASSFMAAAFASENERTLAQNWGGDVGATELYMAHFLGAGGASSFLRAMDSNPLRSAADLFPAAARNNYNVFYDSSTGRARTLAQVYNFFDRKFSASDDQSVPVPPSLPMARQNSIVDSPEAIVARDLVPREQSNSLIMARSQRMRAAQEAAYGQIAGAQMLNVANFEGGLTNRAGLFKSQVNDETLFHRRAAMQKKPLPSNSLMTRPVDLMLLSQDVKDTADTKDSKAG
ncbi:MAG: transglycosylase SLT domain-containing protein [Alphaproteobacteria bacterium]|nr:transglycosylase SLT domain-containing protein [Alphaproteobacteria bacterium]